MSQEQSKIPSSQTKSKAFGKYLLERKLGQGGMGAVYLASDPASQRSVALKIMTVQGQELVERFHREAQSMAKLKHPNIVPVYEVGTIGKYHYFTMEFIQGTSLEDLIKNKNRLSPNHTAGIIRDTALALDYAHKQGIIHRDIKPANILIDSNKHPYLMDFGLAKELTGLDRSLTMSGTVMGTPDYMSPEQAMGEKKRIDRRSDIFSLGATFYHCITGRLPFESKELYQVMNQVIHKDPIPPSRLVRSLPQDLETIILKCMDKEKDRRYQTGRALADDISRYLEGESISARPIGALTRILKKAKRNKIASVSIVGAIIITAIISISLSSASKKQEIEKYRTRAHKEFNAGKYEDVVALCDKLLVLSGQDEEMKSLREKSQSLIKEREDKIQAEEEARKRREEAKDILSRINAGKPSPDDRIKAAEAALKIDPEYGEAYYEMGLGYKTKAAKGGLSPNEYRELIARAFECFSKAIVKSPTLVNSYFERAKIIAYVHKNFEVATLDFNKVIELDPDGLLGYCARGNIAYYEKNYDDAITHYRKAIGINPDYAEACYNLGATYKEKGEPAEAIINLNRAIELAPDYADAYYIRGLIYYQNKQLFLAIEDFSKAIEINPNYAEAYCYRGFAYQQQGDYVKAMSDGAKYMELASTQQIGAQFQDLLKEYKKEHPNKEEDTK